MKKIIPISLFALLSVPILAQQTYVNREWENTTGTIGSFQRTASALDNHQNLIVVSNTLNSSNNTDVMC